MNLDEKKNFIINFLYFAFWIVIIFISIKLLSAYLFPFIIGLIIAYMVQKPANTLAKKTKFKIKKEIFAAILSVAFYMLFFIFFCLLIWFFYSFFSKFVNQYLHGNISSYIELINEKLKALFDNNFETNNEYKNLLNNTINNALLKISEILTNLLSNIVKSIPQIFVTSLITIVATCYLAKDYDKIIKFINGCISNTLAKNISVVKNIFKDCVLKYVFGYTKIFILTFIELTIGLFLLNTKHFLPLALIISIVDLLPILGIGIIILPWAAFEFLQQNFLKAVFLVLIYIFITLIRNFVEPKIIGKQFDINPLFTLFFIFIGFRYGGLFGMILFPIILTVLFTYYRRCY